jgi:hypothetical protein
MMMLIIKESGFNRRRIMTQRLEQAISELQQLPEPAQDAMAALILEQIADDAVWDDAFARSQSQLSKLADKARADITAGRVRRLSPTKP